MIIKSAATTTGSRAGFTIVEVMISMTIVSIVMGMCLSTFLFGLRTMYKDTQRLMTNASLRSFMAQISKETLDASYFYLFPYYTSLDGTVNLDTDYAALSFVDAADDDYDKWVGHGDCLVLITKTALYRTTDIKQIRIIIGSRSTNARPPPPTSTRKLRSVITRRRIGVKAPPLPPTDTVM